MFYLINFRLLELARNLNKADSEPLTACAQHLANMKKVLLEKRILQNAYFT